MHTVYVAIKLSTGECICGKMGEIEDKTGISRLRIPWLATTGSVYNGYIVMYAKDCDFV